MVKLYDGGVYLVNGAEIVPESESEKVKALTGKAANKAEAKRAPWPITSSRPTTSLTTWSSFA